MKTTVLAFLTAFSPLLVGADNAITIDVKPGLWETTVKSEMSGVTMQMPQIPEETLAKMPPEQRARVEAMMKGRGMNNTNTTRSCITREMISQGLAYQNDKSCSYKLTGSSSSRQDIHVECTRGPQQTVGDMAIDRVDAEHTHGSMNMKMSGNTSMSMKMSFDAKFISSDCGDVKPNAAETVKK
jgi:hypothetical protein